MAAFPPRLPEQPIFYPVLNRDYAEQIARTWNTKAEPFAGYVSEFDVDDEYVSQFERQVVGGRQHEELWVPAEELGSFNQHLQGPIRVEEAYFGPGFRGHVPERYGLRGHDADEQIRILAATRSYAPMDFYLETRANELTYFLNYPYWAASQAANLGIDPEELAKTLEAIRRSWDSPGERVAPLIARGTRLTGDP
jgi:hypothetical protein